MHDPFEPFERSRLGWLIPVVLFVLGAMLTVFAVHAMIDIDNKERSAARAAAESADQSDPPSVTLENEGQPTGSEAAGLDQNSEDIVNP